MEFKCVSVYRLPLNQSGWNAGLFWVLDQITLERGGVEGSGAAGVARASLPPAWALAFLSLNPQKTHPKPLWFQKWSLSLRYCEGGCAGENGASSVASG